MSILKKIKPSSYEISKSNKNIEPGHKLLNIISQRFDPVKEYFPIIITLFYFLSITIGMYYHELWRDELDIYARLFYNNFLKYNGTRGPLEFSSLIYYNLLHILVKLVPSFSFFQAFHLIIITLAVYIFNKYSPFSILQKILFTFSYFMVFDYGIISRWYGFSVLIVFLIAYLLTRKRLNYILICALILILANHNISSAIFAVSLILYTIIHILNRFPFKNFSTKEKTNLVTASIIFITGSILILIQYSYSYMYQGNTFEMLGHPPFFMSIRNIWNAYIPIPDLKQHAAFWNTNIIPFPLWYSDNYDVNSFITAGNITACIISIILILLCIAIFSKKLPVLLTFVFCNVTYFIFMHFVLRAYYIRYLGLYFISFVYCCWLYVYSDDFVTIPLFRKVISTKSYTKFSFFNIIITYLITLIFFVQFLAGLYVYPQSIHYQFTKAWETAGYIKNNIPNDYFLVGAVDYAVLPISVILNRDIYFPQTHRCSRFVEYWGVDRNPNITNGELLKEGIKYLLNDNKRIVVILSYELKDNNGNPVNKAMITDSVLLIKIISFEGDIIQSDEQYYLYELRRL